jgi:hypothetical protein
MLRPIEGSKGIRVIMSTLVMALPGLLTIFFIHILTVSIIAIFGMSMFKNVKLRAGFDEVHNFQTFFKSATLLFQVSTIM